MRLVHISDFHFSHLSWSPLSLFSKRILGNLNWNFRRRKHFFEDRVQSLSEFFEKIEPDLILLGGDFTTTSFKKEFEKACLWVGQIKKPWIAIPGNHDCYTKQSFRKKSFYQYLANARKGISHPVEFFNLKDHRVEVHPLQKGWWLIALDTAVATGLISSQGMFSEKLQALLLEALKLIPKEDSIILFNHFPFFQNGPKRHSLIRGEVLQKVIEDEPRIRLYLHGHTHRHSIADLQVHNLPIVLDSGSCAEKKGSWNLIDIDEKGCQICPYRWDRCWTKTKTEEILWKRSGIKKG